MPYPEKLSFRTDSRIVLIGTSTSADDKENLPPIPHAQRNIDHLSRLFKDPDICGLDETCIVRMLDWENASDVTNDLARVAKEATDTLMVYYVGHGLYGDSDNPLYLATTKTTEEGKAFNGISISLVKKAMRSSLAKKRILILDCCYSGRAMEGGMAAQSPLGAAEPAIDVSGTYGIAAVPANAKALAPPGETLTRFTGALVDVLDHGLRKDSNVLTLEDVFDEVERRVREKGDAQPPKRINWDGGSEFCIAFNRALNAPNVKELQSAVSGLRETIKVIGTKIEAIEEKNKKTEDISHQLDKLEAEMSARSSGSDTTSMPSWFTVFPFSGSRPAWERIGLTESDWASIDVYDRINLRRYINGRRNAFLLLTSNVAVCCAAFALLIYIKNSGRLADIADNFLGKFWLGYCVFGVSLIVGQFILSRSMSVLVASNIPQLPFALRFKNETIAQFLNSRVFTIFGLPIFSNLAAATGALILLTLMLSLFVHYYWVYF